VPRARTCSISLCLSVCLRPCFCLASIYVSSMCMYVCVCVCVLCVGSMRSRQQRLTSMSSCSYHDLFIRMTWLIHMWDMSHSSVWYDSQRHTWMSRVTHINGWCPSRECLMSNTWIVTSHKQLRRVIHERVMLHIYVKSHTWIRQIAFICVLCHSQEYDNWHTKMRRVMYEWVMSRVNEWYHICMSHVIYELSHGTYECDTWHT